MKSSVLSIRIEKELYERVHDQPVSPREVVTEALLKYFRYKEQGIPYIPDSKDGIIVKQTGGIMLDDDFIKLEMELEMLKFEVKTKDNIIFDKNEIIEDLRQDKRYLQTQMHIVRSHFMPMKIGFFTSLLPSGRKAIKAKEELNKLEREFITIKKTGEKNEKQSEKVIKTKVKK